MKNIKKKFFLAGYVGILASCFFALPSIGSAESDIYKQEGGQVHYNWGYGAPSGIQNDHFTAQFSQSRALNTGDYFVQTLADDRVKVSFDGKQVIDRWYDVGGQIDRAIMSNVQQGNHKIQTDFYENTGQATIFSDIVPFDHWLAYYYQNKDLSGYPVDAKVISPQGAEKALVENNGEGSPTPKVPVDNFSARYTTVKRLPAGEYIIRGKADDGMRVYIDGKLVIDEWDTGKWDKEHARKITIQDNTASSVLGSTNEKNTHLVEVQYMESINTSDVKFSIEPYAQSVQHDTWTAEYYNNTELKGDAVVVAGKNSKDRIDTLNFNWKDGSPHPNIKSDNFSARFTKVQDFKSGDYYFGGIVDDGVRVYLDDKLIIDDWGGGYDKIFSKKTPVTEGKHKITFEYLELTGGANLNFNSEPYSQAIQKNTWIAEYYNNTELKGDPVHIAGKTAKDKIDNLEFDWKNTSPYKSVPVDNFSARYTKVVNFEEGNYSFEGVTDDGVRVYLDDQLIIDNWIAGFDQKVLKVVPITAGQHKVRVEYMELTGNANLKFNYTKQIPYNRVKMCKPPTPKLRSSSNEEQMKKEKELTSTAENVDIKNASTTISMSWNKKEGLNYKIFGLDDEDKWKEIWSGTDTKYTVENLEPFNTYTYKLISYDNNGNVSNESLINAFTLKSNKDQQQYVRQLAERATNGSNEVNYPMTDAYINSIISGEYVKLSWGNVPNDGDTYSVFKDGSLISTTDKTEYIDKINSNSTQRAVSAAKIYYDVRGGKKIPQEKLQEKEQLLKNDGVVLTNDEKENMECEVKNVSTFIEEGSLRASVKNESKAITSYSDGDTYDVGYRFRYKTFIPMKYADSPVAWMPWVKSKYFHGDDRDFSYYSQAFRTKMDVMVLWKAQGTNWVDELPNVNATPETGVTIGYGTNGRPTGSDKASTSDIQMNLHSRTKKQVRFSITTSSANPMVKGSPTIDAYAYVIIDRNGSGATAGVHDRAPNHEFYRTLYTPFRPENIYALHQSELDGYLGFLALYGATEEFVTGFPYLFAN